MQWIDMYICIDCACKIENNDETSPEHDALFDQAVAREGNPTIAVVGEETHFSWSACDLCQTPLGGDRMLAKMLIKE